MDLMFPVTLGQSQILNFYSKYFLIAFFGIKNKSIEYLNLDYSRSDPPQPNIKVAKARKWLTKL